MKSFNLSVEFNGPSTIPQPHRTGMICFSLPDKANEPDVYALFRETLVSAIVYANTSKARMSAAEAMCMAAKTVKDRFGGESFMLAADATIVVDLH